MLLFWLLKLQAGWKVQNELLSPMNPCKCEDVCREDFAVRRYITAEMIVKDAVVLGLLHPGP